MLTTSEKCRLLAQAGELRARRDYSGLAELLSPVATEDLFAEPELAYQLAHAWASLGREEYAMDVLANLKQISPTCGHTRIDRERLQLEAVLFYGSGDLASAESLSEEVLQAATAAGDQYYVATATNNLATISTIRCQWYAALAGYQKAMAAFHRLGDRTMVAGCHHNLGMVFRQLGLLKESDAHFQSALTYYQGGGTAVEILGTTIERALLLELRGDRMLAEATTQRSLFRAREIRHARLQGEALRVLGTINSRKRDWIRARECLHESLLIARRTSTKLLQAEVLEEIAKVELELGNMILANTLSREAVSLYSEMGATVHVERIARSMLRGTAMRSDRAR